MTLYEINEALTNCMSVNEETGEVEFNEELYAQLEGMRESKLESIALWIKNLDSNAAAIDKEIKSLTARKKATEAKSDRLRLFLETALDGEKLDTSRVLVTYRRSEQVIIDDKSKIPDEYIRVKTETEPDKPAIKKAIKSGVVIAGARIEEKRNMRVE